MCEKLATFTNSTGKSKLNMLEKFVIAKVLHREVQGPCWGYPTEGAYYRDASSTDALLAVRIPLFALHAKDDPVWLSPFLSVAYEY